MCNSNVRQDQDLTEVLAGLLHNALTLVADLEVVRLTRRLTESHEETLTSAAREVTWAADGLKELLGAAPKVER